MTGPCYRGTNIPVLRDDLVRWLSDGALSEVLFVVRTGDYPNDEDDPTREWLRTDLGQGIMLDAPCADRAQEPEDCEGIELVRSIGEHTQHFIQVDTASRRGLIQASGHFDETRKFMDTIRSHLALALHGERAQFSGLAPQRRCGRLPISSGAARGLGC